MQENKGYLNGINKKIFNHNKYLKKMKIDQIMTESRKYLESLSLEEINKFTEKGE